MAIISSINDSNLALLRALQGSSQTSTQPSVSRILEVAQTAYAERQENRAKVTDQLSALTDFNTKIGTLRKSAADLDVNGTVLNVFSDGSDATSIRSSIDAFVEAFNDVRSFAQENSGFFREDLNRTLGSFAGATALDLEDIGISVNSEGLLEVDDDALDTALTDSLSSVRSALGGIRGLATRVNGFADTVQGTGSYHLLSDIAVPERPSRAVELLQLEFFQSSTLSIFR